MIWPNFSGHVLLSNALPYEYNNKKCWGKKAANWRQKSRYRKTSGRLKLRRFHLSDVGRGDFEIPFSPKTWPRNLEKNRLQRRPSQLRDPQRRRCRVAPWMRPPPTSIFCRNLEISIRIGLRVGVRLFGALRCNLSVV